MAQYIFHYCCRTCFSQEIFDKYRCAKCRHFDNDQQLRSLYLSKKEMELLEAESARREIKGLSFNKEEKEAYLWRLREQAEEQARKEDEEMKKRAERAARERRSVIEVKNGRLVEYEARGSLGEKIFRLLRGLVSGR
jgi:uncharacterized protein with gpF-like domain